MGILFTDGPIAKVCTRACGEVAAALSNKGHFGVVIFHRVLVRLALCQLVGQPILSGSAARSQQARLSGDDGSKVEVAVGSKSFATRICRSRPPVV